MKSINFAYHREKLANKMKPGSIALVPSAEVIARNSDTDYSFHQEGNFFYLTGFEEPDAMAVIQKDLTGKVTYTLFNQKKEPDAEIWTGKRTGQEGAIKDFGADKAFAIDDLDKEMPKLLLGTTRIYAPWDSSLTKKINQWKTKARRPNPDHLSLPEKNINLSSVMNELRLTKDEAEVDRLRIAAEISANAHIYLMQNCTPGLFEYQLQGIHDGYCRSKGCNTLAYPSIIASGENACTLHYDKNIKKINFGDLVLVDAAGAYDYYAADITRTFPANGQFSPEQKEIYALVLKAQKAGIAAVKPGVTFDELNQLITNTLVEGLIQLDLLSGTVEENIKANKHKDFYPHSFGHWLGLDVHDVGDYWKEGKSRVLAPNMAFTIEPGIYIQPDNQNVPEKYRGIGVRIEDDILVTAEGREVMSDEVPKEIHEIEDLMGKAQRKPKPVVYRQQQLQQPPLCQIPKSDGEGSRYNLRSTALNLRRNS